VNDVVEHELLLIDGEPDAPGIADGLAREGFVVVRERALDPALDRLRRQSFDLALVGSVLPGADGFNACRVLRQADLLPVIMLAAGSRASAVATALESGADDCVMKPAEGQELVARIRAVLHRHVGTETLIRAGGLEVDVDAYRAWRDGTELELTATEFRLLASLAVRRGQVCSKRLLLSRVWHEGDGGFSRAVDMAVARLRRKIEPDPERPRLIATVRGVGYRLDVEH
jgi:two-component system response regulator MtrA